MDRDIMKIPEIVSIIEDKLDLEMLKKKIKKLSL